MLYTSDILWICIFGVLFGLVVMVSLIVVAIKNSYFYEENDDESNE